ncbi:MAG TPA: IS481 family transposase [Candidatus Limnocylindrales bacterium]|nr:IS481 family transposase [Candidatus Limnocylindrales bacterium]
MSKHRVAVLRVVTLQLSVTAAAAKYGLSRGHLQRLLRRYRAGGLDALEPRSRRPHRTPGRTPDAVRARIVALRIELAAHGLDAGPVTIAWHLEREGCPAPSTATIRRVLHTAGLVTPEPRKRPRSSWLRFEAAAPNELWQSDVTHWRLVDGTEVEICSWLDDHSRYLLACTAFRRVGGDDVVATFSAAGDAYGWPAATLTDNGAVYTSRFTGGRNGFEYLLAYLGIRQKNGAPGHPQTQGKIERFHQTLKRWLGRGPEASSIAGLQARLDAFRLAYNEQRPHRAIARLTPGEAYRRTPRATAAGSRAGGHFRLRYDVADTKGAITLRRAGRLHHLKIGAAHAHRRVLAIVDAREVTVVALDTGEVLSSHLIEPHRGYWRNQRRDPGRWPRSRTTD